MACSGNQCGPSYFILLILMVSNTVVLHQSKMCSTSSKRNKISGNLTKNIHLKNSMSLNILSTKNSAKSYGSMGKSLFQVQRRNERERRRVQAVNQGYEVLAQQLADWDELKNKKLTKAETLKAAIMYIEHLENLLDTSPASTSLNNSNANCSSITDTQIFYNDSTIEDNNYCCSLPSVSQQNLHEFSPINERFSSPIETTSNSTNNDSDSYLNNGTHLESFEYDADLISEHHSRPQSSPHIAYSDLSKLASDRDNFNYIRNEINYQHQPIATITPTKSLNCLSYYSMPSQTSIAPNNNNNNIQYDYSQSLYLQQQQQQQQQQQHQLMSPYFCGSSIQYSHQLTRSYHSV